VFVRRSVRAPERLAVGAGAPLPVELGDAGERRFGRAPGGVAVGAGAGLPIELGHLRLRRYERAAGGVAVGAGERLPVGLARLQLRRCGRAPGGVAVGAGERRDRRGLGRGPRACPRWWAQKAGGADVAGWTQCVLKSRHAIYVRGTASAPNEATNIETMTHSLQLHHIRASNVVCTHKTNCHIAPAGCLV